MVSRNPDPNDRSKMSQSERLCWLGALILGLMIVAMHARDAYGVTQQPTECAASAIAARQAAKLPVEAGRNVYERNFIEISKYLLRESGVPAVFYRNYRYNCRLNLVPKHVRVEDGRVRIMVPL